MRVITHALVGVSLGSVVPGWAAFGAGLVSHAGLDMLPHRDYQSVRSGVVDLVLALGVVVGMAAVGPQPVGMVMGAAGAMLPDLEVARYHLGGGRTRLVFPSHNGRLRHGRARGWRAILVEALVWGAAMGIWLWGRGAVG